MLNRLGRAGRDYARNQITTQGDGEWAPLSKWTRAKTGRRKALITERPRIKYVVRQGSVAIVHAATSPERSLSRHAKGFTRPAVNKPVYIPLRLPSLLGVSGPGIYLPKGTKATKTPPRNVWGTQKKVNKLVRPVVEPWVRQVLNRKAVR